MARSSISAASPASSRAPGACGARSGGSPHPIDNAEPIIYVRGRGATITDATGREYLDGLAGLWNVNVGHGRAELADAAAAQIKEIAYFSAYTGSSNVPAITLASRLVQLAD